MNQIAIYFMNIMQTNLIRTNHANHPLVLRACSKCNHHVSGSHASD